MSQAVTCEHENTKFCDICTSSFLLSAESKKDLQYPLCKKHRVFILDCVVCKKNYCIHGNRKWYCKPCGIGFCSEHGKRKYRCQECRITIYGLKPKGFRDIRSIKVIHEKGLTIRLKRKRS